MAMRGGPEGSASWVYTTEPGDLVIECYDFGAEANAHFGNDVAFLVTVAVADTALVVARFESYFEARRWLDDEGLPYRHDFDGWA